MHHFFNFSSHSNEHSRFTRMSRSTGCLVKIVLLCSRHVLVFVLRKTASSSFCWPQVRVDLQGAVALDVSRRCIEVVEVVIDPVFRKEVHFVG